MGVPKNDIGQDPESISEMLKCGNCSKQMKQPKMLPCQHNYCIDCLLSKMKTKTFSEGKKYIKCKICDKYYQLPKNGPDGLPINRTLLDLQAINNQPILTGSQMAKLNYNIQKIRMIEVMMTAIVHIDI